MSTVAAIVCIAAQAFSCQPDHLRIIDGDTIAFRSEKIRLLGIDAPEIKGACPREKEIARKATDRLASILEGQKVTIQREGRDRYRRTLAILRVNGHDVGKTLVGEGLARKWEKKWRKGLDEVWCK